MPTASLHHLICTYSIMLLMFGFDSDWEIFLLILSKYVLFSLYHFQSKHASHCQCEGQRGRHCIVQTFWQCLLWVHGRYSRFVDNLVWHHRYDLVQERVQVCMRMYLGLGNAC